MMTLTLEDGCDEINSFPLCLSNKEVEAYYRTRTSTTKATTEATTEGIRPKIGGERKTFYFVYNKLDNL